jgi:D-ribose pyranose/furanose isomerase RbsD
MDISKLKISLGLVVAILLQAGGFVWFISELNSQVQHNQLQIESLIEDTEEKSDAIQEIETRIKVIENEMRTIMSDHEGFGDILHELGKAGLIPSGEKRKYGNYE